MARKPDIRVRRIYEEPSPQDGTRVLVDRIWPRGLTKGNAALGEWRKEIAPSTPLRKWYDHDPARFEEFRRRYRAELEQPQRAAALQHLRELAKERPLTLLTATKHPDISEAMVLADLLRTGPPLARTVEQDPQAAWTGTGSLACIPKVIRRALVAMHERDERASTGWT
jgi:uncharacterized protein YeaO (DUF488 family)